MNDFLTSESWMTLSYVTRYSPASSLEPFKLALSDYKSQLTGWFEYPSGGS